MRIVHLSTEFAPIAKAGGLGEVLVGLCRELCRKGEKIDVILPKYDLIDLKKLRFLKMEVPDFKCLEKGSLHPNAMWSAESEECQLHLLEARHSAAFFHRRTIYGCEDDVARFLYFSRACVEYLKLKNEPIDILHLHDWHVAIAAVLVRDLFQLPVKKILLTIHNAEYQGKCATWDLDAIGLDGHLYLTKEKLKDDDPAQQPHGINLLKGGIVYSDAINAVSPTYAKEILTRDIGFHLDSTLRKYHAKLTGILNGIDQKLWDPANDPNLPAPYSAESSFNTISAAKQAARKTLQKRFPLTEEKRPWIGAVTRLASQKGPELLEEGLRQAISLNASFLLLGSTPDPKTQSHFEKLKKEFASNSQVLLHFAHDETLAHQLYAALDFLLVPSHYEPCGLVQLIAVRYGTLPIAHATGGLKDTVFDCEDAAIPLKKRNGFLFAKATIPSMTEALHRAIHLFRKDPVTFQTLIRNGMHLDFSWEKPAQEYLKLYRKMLAHF